MTRLTLPRLVVAIALSDAAVACGTVLGIDEVGYIGADAADGTGAREDSRAADGPNVEDASDTEALAPSGCATRRDASFCVDFESDGSLGPTTWTNTYLFAVDGSVGLSNATFRSPSHSAAFAVGEAVAMGDSGSRCGFASLVRTFTTTYAEIRVSFAVLPQADGVVFALANDRAQALNYFVSIRFQDAGITASVGLFKWLNGVVSQAGSQSIRFDTTAYGTWLEAEVDVSVAAATILVKLGAAPAATIPLPTDYVARNPELSFGPYCSSTPNAMNLDDVAVWLR